MTYYTIDDVEEMYDETRQALGADLLLSELWAAMDVDMRMDLISYIMRNYDIDY